MKLDRAITWHDEHNYYLAGLVIDGWYDHLFSRSTEMQ